MEIEGERESVGEIEQIEERESVGERGDRG